MNDWQKVSIYASALYKYQSKSAHQLSFEIGDEFEIFAANSKGWYRGFLLPERDQQGLIPQTYVKIIYAGEGKQCSKCGFFGTEAFCAKCGNKMEEAEIEELEELQEEEEDALKECEECKTEGQGVFCSECGGKMVEKILDLENLIEEVIDKDQMTILAKMLSKIKRGQIDISHVNFKICSQGASGVQLEDDELIELIDTDKLTNTTSLVLAGCRRLSIKSIKELGKLKQLSSLDVSTIKDPNNFSSFSGSLKSIILKKSGITDEGMASLAKYCPNLTEIDLSFAPKITQKALSEVGNLKKLEKLNLLKCSIDDESLKNLSSLPLSSLHINECLSLTNEGIKHLANISSLTYLNLSNNPKLTGESLASISNLKRLSHFEFANINDVKDVALKHISELSISTLNMNSSNFGTIGLALICKMAKFLVNLDLGSSGDTPRKLDIKDLQLIGLLQKLEVLNLSGCQITPKADEEGFAFFENLKSLKELNILNCLGCNVRGKALIEITKMKTITKLSMNCKVDGDYGLNYLTLLNNLEYLEFKPPSEEVTKDGWKFGDGMKISTFILKNPHTIDDYAWDYLTFYSFEYVNVLWLESKLIKPETWKYFERLECLQNLHFGSSYFDDDDNFSLFIDHLLKCPHLSQLSLKYEGESVSKVTSASWNKIKLIPKITVVKLFNFPRESMKDFDQYQEID